MDGWRVRVAVTPTDDAEQTAEGDLDALSSWADVLKTSRLSLLP
jgi:hypothetical protein